MTVDTDSFPVKITMRTLATFVLISAALTAASAAKIVCYYSSWAIYYEGDGAVQPEDLDANMCTHINYAFVSINSDGSLSAEDEYADIDQGGYKRVVALKEKNSNLKVLLSIGGADAPSQTFSQIAGDAGKRAAMVGSARWFMETYGFDGVDLDWEIPGSGDRANFISLLKDFKDDFSRDGWEVSAAVGADVSDGYDVGQMSQILDHINIMTYDMYGPWSEYTGQNSPLWASSVESEWEKDNLNMDAAIRQWRDAGASAGKLIAGIAFYGHSFTLKDSNNNGLHAPIKGAGKGGPIIGEEGSWSYLEFCENRDSWSCAWDAEQKMPICVSGDQWLGIDDEGSIRNKVAYINSNGLGGAMIWSIDQDDVHGRCGDAKPLLHAIKDNIN
ncbi:acidic mammalian chitinase-like [Tenebrio molitor]|uniref:acidic mammalian chitinase-like n=1 Tax=Tenebrio molitor TaxID=7067 RepID=UPI0036249163